MKEIRIPQDGLYDVHGHYLPGVDDGAKDLETTLQMVQLARDEGIRYIIMTPHCGGPRGRTTAEAWQAAFSEIQPRLRETFPDMHFALACELYYSSDAPEWLEQGQVLTYPGTRYVLVEFDENIHYAYMKQALQRLRQAGVKPVLAHFERYACLEKDMKKIDELAHLGVRFQVNVSTILGDYGFFMKRFILKCIREGYVFVIGSDAHNTGRRTPKMKKCYEYLAQKLSAQALEELFEKNPGVLFGEG